MADPRFYRNCGPFDLAAICAKADLELFGSGETCVRDLASLAGAGPDHLTFFTGAKELCDSFTQSKARVCLVPEKLVPMPPAGMVTVPCASVSHAWAATASLFYPEASLGFFAQDGNVSAMARVAADVQVGPGAVIGPSSEIGAGTRIGAGAVIGRGVAVGRNCDIGANAVITFALVGDGVIVSPNVSIGQPGFGYASFRTGHTKIPQLGRVIIQDRVEIGSGCAIDRGALGDTVIGEGSKLDNLVHIGHNVQIGRHCMLAGQVAVAGSAVIEDFVFMGGQVGIGDHSHTGAGARLAARTGLITNHRLAGGQDYGGTPAKPLKEYFREIYAVSRLAQRRKRDEND